MTENTKKGPIKLSREGNLPFEKNQWYYITLLPTEFVNGAKITIYTETGSLVRTIGGPLNPLNFNMNECRSIASIDAGKTIPDNVTTKIQLNGKSISSTTLWPHGAAALSLKLTAPSGNVIIPDSVTWSSDDEHEAIVTVVDGVVTGVANGNAVITATATYKDKTYSASCTVTVTEAPSQLVAKDFTVDDSGKKVNFAAGNLYTSDGGTTYSFHTFQGQVYSTKETWSVDGQRDLLQWSEVATREPDTAVGTDIPTVFNNVWRALTFDQWDYIINTRTASTLNSVENARFAKATVNGICGLLLFPDEYKHPSGVSLPNKNSINITDCAFSLNYYSGTAWEKLEKAGVVFLPLGGHLTGSTWNYDGRYWSCSTRNFEKGTGGRLQVSEDVCRVTSNTKTDYMSVRLVRFVTE